jgi:hypothetical protein
MPTKILPSPFARDGITPKLFKFGGGKNTTIAQDDGSGTGYIINAGGGDDTVTGSSSADDITGGSGMDDISGGGGNDTLNGGTGSDSIVGGAGDDTINGGELGGTDGDSRKDPDVSNHLVGDTEFGIVAGGATVVFGNDTITGGDGVDNNIYGDNFKTLSLGAGSVFTGGNDILSGGNGLAGEFLFNTINGDSQFLSDGGGGASFTGGNDTLTGGSGVNVTNIMVGDVGSAGGMDITGGNDTLISGEFADDQMTGDWGSAAGALAVGGSDTFVFGSNNGNDSITDFRSADSDKIKLEGTGLAWADLDSSGNGGLDDNDDHVSIVNGNTVIDLGDAANDGTSGVNIVTVFGVDDLIVTDFVFVA